MGFSTVLDCFSLFIDDHVIDLIVLYTNDYITSILPSDPAKQRRFRHTDAVEIRALIGLLMFFGATRLGKGNLRLLWTNKDGRGWDVCPAVMGYERFRFLMRSVHFDDIRTRVKRVKEDNFAIMREIFKHVNEQFLNHYELSAFICIDEQLLKFRGRVRFSAKRQTRQGKPPTQGPCFDCLKETGQRVISRQLCKMEGCNNFACEKHFFKMCGSCKNELFNITF